MDKNGNAIQIKTLISDLPFPASDLIPLICLSQVETAALNDAVDKLLKASSLDQSFSDSTNQTKLLQIINAPQVSLYNIVQLHRSVYQANFQKLVLQFTTILAMTLKSKGIEQTSSDVDALTSALGGLTTLTSTSTTKTTTASAALGTPGGSSSPTSKNGIERLASVLEKFENNQSRLSDQIQTSQVQMAVMMKNFGDTLSASSTSSSFAKVPTSSPPTFSNNEKKNVLSLKRFYNNKFSRWMTENKLNPNDAFVYLHKVFTNKTDQERAYQIIQRCKGDGIDVVLTELSQFFKLNESEILDLQEKFYSYRLDTNSDFEESFNRLYELQASIQAESFSELEAIKLVKSKFQRCVQKLSTNNSNLLRALFINASWGDATSLDKVLQLLRGTLGKSRSDKETQKSDKSASQPPAANPDDMEISAISSSRNQKSKKKGKNKKADRSKESTNSRFILCSKDSCKAKNIHFASFCNKCGATLKKPSTGVSAIEPSSVLTEEESKIKADILNIEVKEGSEDDFEVSNKPRVGIQSLDRGTNRNLKVQVKFFNNNLKNHSRDYKALFDTGATLNYLVKEVFDKYKKRYGLILYDCTYVHNQASGVPLGVLGYTILPVIQVEDSFANVFTLKNVSFRVVNNLSHQVIVGRNIMQKACKPGNAFLVFPEPINKVLLDVDHSSLNLKNSNLGIEINSISNPENPVSYCRITDKEELISEELQKEDILVSSLEPLDKKVINVGTKTEPIFTSSKRTPWFIEKLKNLIQKYRSVTSTHYKPFRMEPVHVEMTGEIPTGGHRFISLPPQQREILKAKVDKYVENGIFKYTSLPANGCLMMVPKNNGVDPSSPKAWRVVNDLVRVNKYVKPVDYHLPPILDLLNQCEGYTLFTKLDIPDAYDCVPMKSDQPIVAMVPGHHSNVVFTKLAQGLKPSSGFFCIALDKFFQSIPDLLKYLDDLLLKARAEAEMIQNLDLFFKTCQEFDVRISLSKSQFGVGTLEFLSFKISDGRIGISDSHRKAIESIKGEDIPADSLAGFFGYFSNYINDKNLLHMLRNDNGWSTEKELALEQLKEKILEAPMRTLVNFKNELRIYVDASDTGLSTALFQVCKDGKDMELVSLFNKNMVDDASWANKNIYQRELLALAVAVSKYEYMLRGGHRVVIFTDNKAVAQSHKSRAFVIRNLFDRLKSDFPNVVIKSLTSSENTVADILSRAKFENVDEVDRIAKIPVNLCQVLTRNQTKTKPIEADILEKDSAENIEKEKSKTDKSVDILEKKLFAFHVRGGHHSVEKIFDIYKLMFQKEYPGLTLNRLRNTFSRCSCPIRKRDKSNFIPRYPSVNRELFLDFKEVGTSRCKLNSSKKMYRLSVIEPLSGAIWSVPHLVTTGESVVNSISLILQVHGKVLRLRTDNAPAFVAGALKTFCDAVDIQIKPSSVSNPTANVSERHHSNINKIINLATPTFQDANNIIFNYTTSYNTLPATHGFIPYEVLKGHLPLECLPSELDVDLDKEVTQELTSPEIIKKVWQIRSKKSIDKLPDEEREQKFQEGQRVIWQLKLPTGGLKLYPATVVDINPSSALLRLDHDGRTQWIAQHHIRRTADIDILDK